jgi:seryl-tRNA synthetase
MVATRAAPEFRADLLAAQVLVPTAIDGLYHRSGAFERISRGVENLVSRTGSDEGGPLLYLPPIMPRVDFEQTDYVRSFPDLLGSIDIFVGDDRDHAALLRTAEAGGDWTQALTPADVVLSSAACHALYPSLRDQILPSSGRRVECQGFVFRHEPSLDPARMQSFRMHEFVYLGEPVDALAHRDRWLQRGLTLLGGLGLEVDTVVANDPFFGRTGRMLAANQRDTALKLEIVAPITTEQPTAISSGNNHEDHFGSLFGIKSASGGVAHSACFAFGIERITLALLSRHGLDSSTWPSSVSHQLWR